jgi:hypothetical protein
MQLKGVAAGLIHDGQPVTEYLPGYYRRATDGQPVAGYALHCANWGEPIEFNTEPIELSTEQE